MDTDAARDRLRAEQERVEGLIGEFRSELGEPEAEDGSELSDAADGGSDTFEREKDLAILGQLEAELAELQAAMERVDAGTYGLDEVTGDPIDPARLDAVPTARTNVDRCRCRCRFRRDPKLTVRLRLFAQAREAAGRAEDQFDQATLGAVLDAARTSYGPTFAAVLDTARVWINGEEPVDGPATVLADGDEVAVIPPVSGGA